MSFAPQVFRVFRRSACQTSLGASSVRRSGLSLSSPVASAKPRCSHVRLLGAPYLRHDQHRSFASMMLAGNHSSTWWDHRHSSWTRPNYITCRQLSDKHQPGSTPTTRNDDDVSNKNKNNQSSGSSSSRMGQSLQPPAGCLWNDPGDELFIPEVALHASDGRQRRRVLILCTGGTLTMGPDADGALAPVEGALSRYMAHMHELHDAQMPDYVLHEYQPFYDSSDLGPADWVRLAQDIQANYWHFDGFVVLMGTDTMAYCATALSFLLENLGKPVIFTGSQIPLCEPHNDARHNLIMALLMASRDTIQEVAIFFHDRLLRACRTTKVNTHQLLAFDSPNLDPLATIGISIDENPHILLPPPRGALRVHSNMDTRLLIVRLVPGFDDGMMEAMIRHGHYEDDNSNSLSAPAKQHPSLRAIVLQLYGTGNLPSVKDSFVQLLADASDRGILVVASTQCLTGSVLLGHYAVGKALEQQAGVVSAHDMTLEAIACKVGYLLGRRDLSLQQVKQLMGVSLRGEVTTPTPAGVRPGPYRGV